MTLVNALLAEGYAVQLENDPKETTREDHGFVRVKGADGGTLAESADYQHNRCYRDTEQRTTTLMESVRAAAK